jgi:hypothetical protein
MLHNFELSGQWRGGVSLASICRITSNFLKRCCVSCTMARGRFLGKHVLNHFECSFKSWGVSWGIQNWRLFGKPWTMSWITTFVSRFLKAWGVSLAMVVGRFLVNHFVNHCEFQ